MSKKLIENLIESKKQIKLRDKTIQKSESCEKQLEKTCTNAEYETVELRIAKHKIFEEIIKK
jgi:hypothetical protein